MPELPEVETIVRDLRPLLVGRKFVSVRRTSSVALRKPWDAAWEQILPGQTVRAIDRRGKWIVLFLDGESALVVHLGMTGQFVVVDPITLPESHLHLVFDLDDGKQLRFRDTRRFGSATYYATEADRALAFEETGLGPEPFDLDPAAWKRSLEATKRSIKAVLMDQSVVAGVGNIYADEALFRAGMHPARIASTLTGAEADRVLESVQAVLMRAIDARGSSIRDYVGGSGLRGGFQEEFSVYGRKGEPCPKCQTPIESRRQNGRASHYCPVCQPAPPESQAETAEDE